MYIHEDQGFLWSKDSNYSQQNDISAAAKGNYDFWSSTIGPVWPLILHHRETDFWSSLTWPQCPRHRSSQSFKLCFGWSHIQLSRARVSACFHSVPAQVINLSCWSLVSKYTLKVLIGCWLKGNQYTAHTATFQDLHLTPLPSSITCIV